MNVFEVYNFVNYLANKDQSGKTFTPEQLNLAFKVIDIQFLKLKYGLPEDYRPGAPLPRQAWEITQKITDDLRRLKEIMGGRTKPLMLVDADGYADLPSDYIHYSSIRYDSTLNANDCADENKESSVPVEVLRDNDFDARLWSDIKKPWTKYPFSRFNNDHIEFRPRTIKFVVFSYIRMPQAANLVYTLNDESEIVYDADASTQLEWPQDMHDDICNQLYKWLGQNLSSQEMVSAGTARQDKGI